MSDAAGRRRTRLRIGGVEVEVISAAAPSLAGLGLSDAEREVARLVARGASNAEIAARRGISTRTAEKQVAACMRRLAVGSRAELAAKIEGLGPLSPDRGDPT